MTPKVDPGPATAWSAPRFLNAGEAALVVEFGEVVDPAINDRVLALDAVLRADPPAGAREFVPTYRSLMIHYDPLQIDRDTLVTMVGRAMGTITKGRSKAATWTLPCCYDPALAEEARPGTTFRFEAVAIAQAVAARREEAALLARCIVVEPMVRAHLSSEFLLGLNLIDGVVGLDASG